jgi:hypothetical protein
MSLKYLRIYLLVLLPYFGLTICSAQTIWRSKTYTTNQEICEIYTQNLQNCEEVPYCKIENFSCGDLVVHPNGNFYIIGYSYINFNWMQAIRVYDTCDILKTILLPDQVANINLGQQVVSLCADKDGQIFISISGKKNIYKFDPDSELFTDLGVLPNGVEVFDFTFRNGALYATGTTFTNSYIMEIDLNDISQSKVLFSDNNNAYFAKLITIPDLNDCKESVTYITRELNNGSEIGILDFTDESFTYVCMNEGKGMASPLEFLASDPECELLFDLDRDNSSGVFPYDFRNEGIVCNISKVTSIVDKDVYLHTSADLDSIIITMSGDLDGASEAIVFSNIVPNAALTFTNDRYLLSLTGDQSDAAWMQALQALEYSNTSATPSAGLRTITFTAYNAIKSNQAQTLIRLGTRAYAGRDTSIVICTSTQIDGFSRRIGGQSGGYWSPPFAMSDSYDAAIDLATTYRYIVESSDCGPDTATVLIDRLPLRTLNLGPNISLCRAESHSVSIPTITGDQVIWSDGDTQANRIFSTPGTYIVTITTTEGCTISDSITISRSYTKISKSTTIDLCQGETYEYGGQIYQAGETIIDSLEATSGCDTLWTLTLYAIAAPTIIKDTTTCDNGPITFQGKTYQIGDTIIRTKNSATGCDTVMLIVYGKYESSIKGVYVVDTLVCKGLKSQVVFESNNFKDLIWSNGDFSKVAQFGAGQHSVQAIDSLGCLQTIPFEIKSYPSVQYELQKMDPMCLQDNGSITIINKNTDLPFTAQINGIVSDRLENLHAGKYDIILTDTNGCETQDSLTLTTVSDLEVTMPSEISGTIGQIISIAYISSGGKIDTITFNPSSDIAWESDSISVAITGDRVYSITFIDEYGCTINKTLNIDAEIPSFTLALPNIISSQATDPQNALFYLKAEGVTYDLSIYDRWGNLIHNVQKIKGGDPTQAWQPSRSKVGQGVYVYLITIHTDQGVINKYGTVTVL